MLETAQNQKWDGILHLRPNRGGKSKSNLTHQIINHLTHQTRTLW
eukprot:jgi/Mesvir1/20937/Mv08008-RA.1